ncbi:MAG: cysteine--tRNA ligase, partial [Dehalococcoidia bacterium]
MLSLYNTLTRRREEVGAVESGVVRMYTCGPTVYRDVHIGNLRSYLMADWIRRV